MVEARGWAFVGDDGEIDVKTVSPTAQAAKVNAIAIGSGGLIMPLNSDTSDDIDNKMRRVFGALENIKQVKITLEG